MTLRIYDARRPSNSKRGDRCSISKSDRINLTLNYLFTESVIQFLKRQSPVLSALFSPVDANQLALVEHNSLYVVDIRKPKRSVLNTPLIVSYSFLNNFKLSFVSVIFTI